MHYSRDTFICATVSLLVGWTFVYIFVPGPSKPEPDAPLELASPPSTFWRGRKQDNDMPRILLWHRDTTPSADAKDHLPSSSSNVANCSLSVSDAAASGLTSVRCEVTDDRTRIEWSDAVVFQAERVSPEDMPTCRAGFQNWVLWTRDHVSPVGGTAPYLEKTRAVHRCGHSHPKVSTEFDWTMGHREDSDIATTYKTWNCDNDEVVAASGNETVAEIARRNRDTQGYDGSQRRDAVWIVGKCELKMCRNSVVDAVGLGGVIAAPIVHGVRRYVNVDLITDCGRSTCGSRKECLRKIAARYRLVFVSADPDCFLSPYELVFDAFEYDLLPVLLTPPDEVQRLPPLSVVYSGDLESLENVVSYLRILTESPKEYARYFAWKRRCTLNPEDAVDDFCQLCVALNNQRYIGPIRPDPRHWWSRREAAASCNTCPERPPGFAWAFPVFRDFRERLWN
ncbi:hypothetical protein MTO96_041399 [Rhipicephalus appendiculatus]